MELVMPHSLQQAIFLTIGLNTLACQDAVDEKDTSASSTDTNDTTDTTDTTDTSTAPTNTPDPIPDGDYPICSGDTSWSMGQCCVDVYCTEPESSGDCREPSDATAWDDATAITGLSLGSGDCLCETPEGPYNNTNATQYTSTNGECCYLVGIAGCEGRPLKIAGQIRKATLRIGHAWRA